jgi:methionyl-tRNA synthetase
MIIYECDMCGKHYKSADSVRVVELPSKRIMLTVPEKKSFMICDECGEHLCNFIQHYYKNSNTEKASA